MIREELVDRNEAFVREHLKRHLNILLSNAVRLMDDILSGALWVLRGPARLFFYPFVKIHMRRSAVKAIDFLMELVRRLALDGIKVDSDKFDEIVEEEFPKWLDNDHIIQYCRKRHKNFERIKDISKLGFKWQVIPMLKFVSNPEEGLKQYPDLCRSTYKKPEDCQYDLDQQLVAIKDGLAVAGEDVSIYDIPLFKQLFHENLIKLFSNMTSDFHEDIDLIYKNEIDHLYKVIL